MIRFRNMLERADRLEQGVDLEAFLRHYLPNRSRGYLSQVVTSFNTSLEAQFSNWSQPAKDKPRQVPPGFPWITAVLGSGCVSVLLRNDGIPLRSRVALIRSLLDDEEPLPDGLGRGEFAARFANSLIRDRLEEHWDDSHDLKTGHEAGLEQPDRARQLDRARLLLSVALLTRLHHEAMAEAMHPVPHWDDKTWPIETQGARWPEIETALASTLTRQLELLEHSEHLATAVRDLVTLRLGELRQHNIVSLAALRLLTECSWYYLVTDCLDYPGWSDLMLGLAMGSPPPIRHQDGRARPLYDIASRSAEELTNQYRAVAASSWTSRLKQGTTRPPTIHDHLASVLCRQAALHNRNPGPGTVPLASAFVTSFDLELELALVAVGQSFVLAVPAFVELAKTPMEVSVVWLGCVIDAPDRGVDEISFLDTGSWFVLSGASQFGSSDKHRRNLPVIVRLSGCPAMKLPNLDADTVLSARVLNLVESQSDAPRADDDRARKVALHPLYVLDEYVAGVLGATESFLDHLDNARLGLPRRITGTPGGVNGHFARFWLVLGTQMNDSSIRQRIVAQLASPALSAPTPTAHPTRTGLVVNRRISGLDGRLMQWQGFDIVVDRCEALADDLRHYATHLGQVHLRCDPDGRCPLDRPSP